jgi:preprotein translocase subunit SecA
LATTASRFDELFSALNTPYPERQIDPFKSSLTNVGEGLDSWVDTKKQRLGREKFTDAYLAFRRQCQTHDQPAFVSGPAFTLEIDDVKRRLRKTTQLSFDEITMARAFALVATAVFIKTGLELRTTQVLAARTMLQGRLAEMATGEGKTYAAFLASATAGLAGIPVHLMTANEYLAVRDAESLAPIFGLLGLRCASIKQDMQRDERREIYRNDIVYCTASEVIFDYLKDRLEGGHRSTLQKRLERVTGSAKDHAPVLRGLCFALIDEADSILIDDASTPFILAAAHAPKEGPSNSPFHYALEIAAKFAPPEDFSIRLSSKRAELTEHGKNQLTKICASLPGLWSANSRYREELVELALAALHCFARDVDYVIVDDTIQIVDANTGRIAVGRHWSRGLHQLIEVKESLSQTQAQRTMIQLTYQRFFPRYLMLSGMSGTLRESATELRRTYGLHIDRIPPFIPSQRTNHAAQLYFDQKKLDEALLHLVRQGHERGQPILIGTDSVDESHRVSRFLKLHALSHSLLNAQEHALEALIIAKAGQSKHITVATNMAGRGTDITLGEGVKALGGLMVISCQCNGSRRIDRQLSGRSGRRGDPGSSRTLLNVQRGVLAKVIPQWAWAVLRAFKKKDGALPTWLGEYILRRYQTFFEGRAMRQRSSMMSNDEAIEKRLSFGGLKD